MINYSFVLICFNNWNLTEQAIKSLFTSLNPSVIDKGVEVVIVNNGSTDETEKELERLKHPSIQINSVHLKVNAGYAIGVNVGLAQARGEIVTIINNDLIFPENWFNALRDLLENNTSLGIAAPFLSFGSGIEDVSVTFETLEEMKKFARDFMMKNKDKLLYSERIIGACMSIKRELLEKIGGNDFWFGLGLYDDDDFSLRANVAGYLTVISGGSFVHHIGSATFSNQSEVTSAAISSNGPKFHRKWRLDEKPSRREIIYSTNFDRNKHLFPLNWRSATNPYKKKKGNKSLIVCDWSNVRSKWREELVNLVDSENPIFLWIPNSYFDNGMIKNEIEKIFNVKKPRIIILDIDIAPVDIPSFLGNFSHFVIVKDDYVNRYLYNLYSKLR